MFVVFDDVPFTWTFIVVIGCADGLGEVLKFNPVAGCLVGVTNVDGCFCDENEFDDAALDDEAAAADGWPNLTLTGVDDAPNLKEPA